MGEAARSAQAGPRERAEGGDVTVRIWCDDEALQAEGIVVDS